MSRPRICLLNGKHTLGSEWERECPLRNFDKRSQRSRRNALEGWALRREREARLRAAGLSGAYPTPRTVPRYRSPASRAQSGRPLFVRMHQASDR
jgi:hypothetical protein